MVRIFADTTQRLRPAHVPAARMYLSRDGGEELPQGRLPENRIEFLGPALARSWALRRAQERVFADPAASSPIPPRAAVRGSYRPQDQSCAHPLHLIIDRATGVQLAQVRGTPEFIKARARDLATVEGGTLADLIIKLAGE